MNNDNNKLEKFTQMLAKVYVRDRYSLADLGGLVNLSEATIRNYFEKYLKDKDTVLYDKVKKTAERNSLCNREFFKHHGVQPQWGNASDLYLEYMFINNKVENVAIKFGVSYDAARCKKYRLKEKLKKQDLCL